ncbi:MAG: transketolase [Deltaproteobacteria bacterium]|nr:transketolase [Deltaproteobacteria bacterium]
MSPLAQDRMDQISVDTLRFLSVDMVEKANSGHPGAPMGLAPLAYTIWAKHLRHDPTDPSWANRDRFVLSCGHASALIYSLLHLSGYDLPLEELENFRQMGSRTAGHPEYGLAPGIETTTGPLGQGLGNAVGMALARTHLAARFNRPDFPLFDHRIWVLASDGDLMEGIASEASSLAGHLKLGSLKVFYDDNRITIDGSTDLAFTEDVAKRYEAYGWVVHRVEDGNDLAALDEAASKAAEETERPTLVVVRTNIGYGSPNKQDTAKAHGSPLGAEEIALTKKALGWPLEPTFLIPSEAREAFRSGAEEGALERHSWQSRLRRYSKIHPQEAAELASRQARELPEDWPAAVPSFSPEDGPMATRKASGNVLNALATALPRLMGGSADLAGSNNTMISDEEIFSAEHPEGRNMCFGVREHAMGSIMNGMALSGLLIPYGGTFLIFSDYMRPAMRLAALMGQQAIYVMTHDSIFLGEDGPTHQPISQLLSLRSIPNLTVLRPADANETAQAWRIALERQDCPTALVLTRQKLPILEETEKLAAQGVCRGAYVLADPPEGIPQAILLATGSEVALALDAHSALAQEGIRTRVVSMPSWELFEAQSPEYRRRVLPAGVGRRLAIEAGSPLGWHRYVGPHGDTLTIDGFGESAPYEELKQHFGFTTEAVVARVHQLLGTS